MLPEPGILAEDPILLLHRMVELVDEPSVRGPEVHHLRPQLIQVPFASSCVTFERTRSLFDIILLLLSSSTRLGWCSSASSDVEESPGPEQGKETPSPEPMAWTWAA